MLAENETAEPVTKYGLLIIVTARMAAFSYDVSLSLYCQRVSKGGSGDTWTHNGLHYRKRILSLGNPDLLQWASSKTAWPLEQRETVKKKLLFAQEGDTMSTRAVHYTNIIEQKGRASSCKMYQNIRNP